MPSSRRTGRRHSIGALTLAALCSFPLVARVQSAPGSSASQSDFGLGFQGMVGKEWMVSPHWGLGAAAELIGASMKDKTDPNGKWTAGAFSLAFSATYN